MELSATNFENVKTFYYVAKMESFTKAAEFLHVSQPAVSQSMKQLESALRCKLFIRAFKGIRLTKEGEIFFSYVEKGYEQILLGENKLSQLLELACGELKIGASDMTLQYYLLPYLETFHEQFPDVKVMVTNAPTPETLKKLKEGAIDFGIISTPFVEDENYEVVRVKEIEDIFVGGRKFISYKNKTIDLVELENLPIISLEKNTSSRTYMDSFLAKNGIHIEPEFELATSDMIVQFAIRSLGIGCVMEEFAREHLDIGTIFQFRFNKKIPKRHFCLVMDKRTPLSPSAKKLLSIVRQNQP